MKQLLLIEEKVNYLSKNVTFKPVTSEQKYTVNTWEIYPHCRGRYFILPTHRKYWSASTLQAIGVILVFKARFIKM